MSDPNKAVIENLRAEVRSLRRDVERLLAEPRRPLGPRAGGGAAAADLAGEFQYMVHMQVTDNQDGYDFVRAHPVT